MRLTKCVVCGCILSWAVAATPAGDIGLYVARDGNDDNPGTQQRPFASLEKARDAARDLKYSGGLPPGGVVVHLREGAYELRTTFRLTAGDAGSENAPIVYRAYPGEKVVLTGGRSIAGFVPHRGSVLKADGGAKGFEGVRF